jgi:choline dehydrogenase
VYDYIIVGAGSAGCVLAARLSADPDVKVLLLEAGPVDDADEIRAPAAVNRLFQTTYDWNYRTVPQHRAAGRSIYWPRGRVLGGSSSINTMIYIRGSRYDYQAWREDHGCTGWTYPDVMPYFLRAEDNSRTASKGSRKSNIKTTNTTGNTSTDPYHATGGPLAVTDTPYKSKACQAFIDAAAEQGVARNDDFNGPDQDGVGWYQVTQRRGRRWSAADAYLRPAEQRPNLTIQTNALVTKVIIDNHRAIGVQVLRNGQLTTERVNAEVILSGGAINSPQLLMLSGVGPADHLTSMGIDTIVDSPGVGANLSDHPVVPVVWTTPNVKGLWEQAGPAGALRWQLTHRGPLTSNIAESGGFMKTSETLSAPDLQWHVLPAEYRDEGLADPARRAMTVMVALVDVASRGRIRLRSNDPRHRPAIDPGYVSDAEGRDLAALLEGVRRTREFARAKAMSAICQKELNPGLDTGDLVQYIQNSVGTLYHPVGSCAMGGSTRLNSVVDPELRVRGVANLRIVDASIMPTVPRGNTNAPTIAIAERAADLIAGRAPLAPFDPAEVAALLAAQAAAQAAAQRTPQVLPGNRSESDPVTELVTYLATDPDYDLATDPDYDLATDPGDEVVADRDPVNDVNDVNDATEIMSAFQITHDHSTGSYSTYYGTDIERTDTERTDPTDDDQGTIALGGIAFRAPDLQS